MVTNENQVAVGQLALGDLLDLARRAAYSLRSSEPLLSDALTGAAAEVELSTFLLERVPC